MQLKLLGITNVDVVTSCAVEFIDVISYCTDLHYRSCESELEVLKLFHCTVLR
jgi:hypothetical protein